MFLLYVTVVTSCVLNLYQKKKDYIEELIYLWWTEKVEEKKKMIPFYGAVTAAMFHVDQNIVKYKDTAVGVLFASVYL